MSKEAKCIHVSAVADLSQLLSRTRQDLRNVSPGGEEPVATHLRCRRQEGGADPVHVAGVDLDADVTIVNLQEAEGSFFGADVALARERRHRDGVLLLTQRQVVTQGAVHVALRRNRQSPVDPMTFFSLMFRALSLFIFVLSSVSFLILFFFFW